MPPVEVLIYTQAPINTFAIRKIWLFIVYNASVVPTKQTHKSLGGLCSLPWYKVLNKINNIKSRIFYSQTPTLRSDYLFWPNVTRVISNLIYFLCFFSAVATLSQATFQFQQHKQIDTVLHETQVCVFLLFPTIICVSHIYLHARDVNQLKKKLYFASC